MTIIPESFINVLTKSAKQGSNVYSLYTDFTYMMKKEPICRFSLKELKSEKEAEKNIHFSCHNMGVILEQIN